MIKQIYFLQILCVALPTVIFIVYTAHKMTKIAEAKKLRKEEQDERKKRKEQAKKLREEARKKAMAERDSVPPGTCIHNEPLPMERLTRKT